MVLIPKVGPKQGSSAYGNENTPLAPSESRSQKSADGRMATGRPGSNVRNPQEEKKNTLDSYRPSHGRS